MASSFFVRDPEVIMRNMARTDRKMRQQQSAVMVVVFVFSRTIPKMVFPSVPPMLPDML